MLAIDTAWAVAILSLQIGIAGLLLLMERRITRVETDMRWLMSRRRKDQEDDHEPHHST